MYVLPKFAGSELDRIEREHVKRFISDLRARGLAKNTIRLAVTTLRAVLSAAIEDRLIEHNPAQGLGRFVKSEKAVRESSSLKPKEVERLSRELRRVLLQLRDERLVKAFADGKPDICEELVFPSDAGTPIEMNNFTARVFKPLLTKTGLRSIRFQDLRHTFGL